MSAVGSQNVIDVADVSFSYEQEVVLQHISLSVSAGDYIGIIGPNGAGKTTLLKVMLGLLHPAHGSVHLFGEPLTHFRGWSRIGYVPQKVTNFDVRFPATVQEVVLMGRYARRGLLRMTTKKDSAIVRKSLERVGMWSLRNRLIGDLSGGQQQRVFIARALASEPEVVLLDEPTIGIDQKARGEFYSLLRELNTQQKMTLVLVSHDLETVVAEAKHVAYVNTTLEFFGTSRNFLKDKHAQLMIRESTKTPHGKGHA